MIKKLINWLKGISDEEIEERFHESHNKAYEKICNDDDGEFSIIVEKDVIEMYIDSYKNQTTWVKCKDNGDIEKAYIVGDIDYIWDENDSKFIEPESLYEVTFIRIKLPINLKNIFVVNALEDKYLPYRYIVEKYKKDENHR